VKILYFTNKPIYPLVDGGCIAMNTFLSHLLALKYEVDHLCISTHKHPFDCNNYPSELRKQIDPIALYENTKLNPINAFFNLLIGKSYNLSRFYSRKNSIHLQELLNSKYYDFIIFDSIFAANYVSNLKKNKDCRFILRAPNVEYKIWQDHFLNESNVFKQFYLKNLVSTLKKEETQIYEVCDGVLPITEEDSKEIRSKSQQDKVQTIPFSISIDNTNFTTEISEDFFFLGAYNWKPNLDAAKLLLNEIIPRVVARKPTVKFHFAGSFMPKDFYNYTSDNIQFHGEIENVATFFKKQGTLVAPIYSGSGVRIKFLEALSIGVPIITTPLASAGIDNNCFVLANKPDDFINEICNLTTIEKGKLSSFGIQYIRKKHSSQSVEAKIKAYLEEF
jgi:glycosyltransferase involved in cell wall biosynthesis